MVESLDIIFVGIKPAIYSLFCCSGVVFGLFFFSPLRFSFHIMSAIQDISTLVSESEGNTAIDNKYHGLIESAVDEVANLMKGTRDSLKAICRDVEVAASREELREAFKRLNGVWSIFLGLELPTECDQLLVEAISAINSGPRFDSFLATASSASSALSDYKAAIMSQLADTQAGTKETCRRCYGRGAFLVVPPGTFSTSC